MSKLCYSGVHQQPLHVFWIAQEPNEHNVSLSQLTFKPSSLESHLTERLFELTNPPRYAANHASEIWILFLAFPWFACTHATFLCISTCDHSSSATFWPCPVKTYFLTKVTLYRLRRRRNESRKRNCWDNAPIESLWGWADCMECDLKHAVRQWMEWLIGLTTTITKDYIRHRITSVQWSLSKTGLWHSWEKSYNKRVKMYELPGQGHFFINLIGTLFVRYLVSFYSAIDTPTAKNGNMD